MASAPAELRGWEPTDLALVVRHAEEKNENPVEAVASKLFVSDVEAERLIKKYVESPS